MCCQVVIQLYLQHGNMSNDKIHGTIEQRRCEYTALPDSGCYEEIGRESTSISYPRSDVFMQGSDEVNQKSGSTCAFNSLP